MSSRLLPLSVAAFLAVSATAANAEPFTLAPTLAGAWAAGTGANAEFRAIDANWRGSSVYWNEPERKYSATPAEGYEPIGNFSWGTGVWGWNDWKRVQSGEVQAIASWAGTVAHIDQSNQIFRENWTETWGEVGPLPAGIPEQNWTAHYTGYLRIADPGFYNFGVLYDDGFFLRIHGAGDEFVEISSDFIRTARERLGFDTDLLLSEGLYRFELGAYNRLQAGVVQLAWTRLNGPWETVPTEHLVTDPTRIPLPGTLALIAVGGVGFVSTRKRLVR